MALGLERPAAVMYVMVGQLWSVLPRWGEVLHGVFGQLWLFQLRSGGVGLFMAGKGALRMLC